MLPTDNQLQTEPTDEVVMEAVSNGELDALAILFKRYQHRAFGMCYRMSRDRALADDLVQEAFVRALRYRGSFRTPSSFSAWFYRIVRNVCLDVLQARDREAEFLDRWSSEHPADPDAAGSSWGGPDGERVAILRAALEELPGDRREVLLLRRQGLTYAEIAERCGSRPGALRVRVHRALNDLRRMVRMAEEQTQ